MVDPFDQVRENQEGAFRHILEPNNAGNPDDDPAPGADKKDKEPNVQDLVKKVGDLSETVRQMSEENKQLKTEAQQSAEIIGRMKKTFVGPEDDSAADLEKEFNDMYDRNPSQAVDRQMTDRLSRFEQEQAAIRNEMRVERVLAEIKQEWDIDFRGKDGKEVKKQLGLISPAAKNADPKGAILSAMKLAGVGKKRTKPPEYDHSSLNGAKPRPKTEVDDIKKMFAKHANASRDSVFGRLKRAVSK